MKKVPLSRCKRCAHFNSYTCPLADLDPCEFVYDPHEKAKDRFLTVVTILVGIAIMLILFAGCKKKPEPMFIPKFTTMELLRMQHHELSNFDKLTMAIALTESRFNPDADSGHGDSGLLQLREVYIDEVNRLYGTDYTIQDAFDIEKSLEMFHLMQDAYNPTRDLDEAIRHHNKSSSYKRVVMENYELICRMEEVRAKLVKK